MLKHKKKWPVRGFITLILYCEYMIISRMVIVFERISSVDCVLEERERENERECILCSE